MDVATQTKPLLTVVVPVYNEAPILHSFLDHLTEVLGKDPVEYEVIIVDDGSVDGTTAILRGLSASDQRLHYLSLSRNFGHQLALKAGLDHATGQVVVTMDGDGQHPAELIPRMVELWADGFDIVNTRRISNADDSILKKVLSRLAYPTLRRMTGLALEPGLADFRLLDRRVVDLLVSFREHHVFFRGLVGWIGFNAAVLTYDADRRLGGRSKYPLRKQWELAVNGLFSFSRVPLRAVNGVGLLSALVALTYSIYVLVIYLFNDKAAPGWASLAIGLMFTLAYLSFCFGALGEYIGRTYIETLGRPHYLVKEAGPRRESEAACNPNQQRRALLERHRLSYASTRDRATATPSAMGTSGPRG